jgi:hypothetical protein
MIFFQLAILLFAVFMIYVVSVHKKKNIIGAFEFGVWIALWAGFMFCVLFPGFLSDVTQRLHFARAFDLLIVIGMSIMILLTVQNRMHQKTIEKKLEEMVRNNAMKKGKV